MKEEQGLPFVKFMMLLGSLAPLFVLVGVRGMDEVISYQFLWVIIGLLLLIPFGFILIRLKIAKKVDDRHEINVNESKLNKEYLFSYLFTVLLPLYSVNVTNPKEFAAIIIAILFVIFILWNLNLHFINFFFALKGYKVYTLPNERGGILLSTRPHISDTTTKISAHRLGSSVFIELKDFNYGIK